MSSVKTSHFWKASLHVPALSGNEWSYGVDESCPYEHRTEWTIFDAAKLIEKSKECLAFGNLLLREAVCFFIFSVKRCRLGWSGDFNRYVPSTLQIYLKNLNLKPKYFQKQLQIL